MSLYEKLQKTSSEEDVKDLHIKALGLKGYRKNLINIQTDEIWFEAKDRYKHYSYEMFTQLLHYIYDMLSIEVNQFLHFSVLLIHVAAIIKTSDALPPLKKKTIKRGKSANGYTQETLDIVSTYMDF